MKKNVEIYPDYKKIKELLNNSPDLICRKLEIGGTVLEILFLKNLVKHEFLNEYVIGYLRFSVKCWGGDSDRHS